MATKITLGSSTIVESYPHQVYTRASWADDWELQATLHCDEAVWSCAPSIPTATLHKYYGDIAREGSLQFAKEESSSLLRTYVKIVFPVADGTHTWYGVIEIDENDLDGVRHWVDNLARPRVTPTGEQTFTAYGLEQLLASHVIDSSVMWSSQEIGRGIPFNENGKPNAYQFDAGIWEFANDPSDVNYWNTRAIVQYLLRTQTPKDRDGEIRVPFAVPFDAYRKLARWDKPEVTQHHVTTYDLLASLMPRQRLLLWYLDVDETKTPNEIRLRVETLNKLPVDLQLQGSDPIPANTRLKHLVFDSDQSARAVVKTSAIESFDQFVVQGARRRSAFSLGFDDSTLAIGWTTAQESLYEDGAKYATGYPAATEITARRKLHAETRSVETVKDVYVRFVIPDTWNGKVGAGDGTSTVVPAFPVVQLDGTIASEPAPFFLTGMSLDATLPLFDGVDYSGDTIPDGTVDESNSTGVERTPLVAWKLPSTSPQRWQDVETIGRKADLETEDPDEIQGWSCEVIVPPNDRGIRLHVHGEPQHIIAKTDFTGQSEDDTVGDHDYRDMICTMSVTEDRHAEGRYPPDASVLVFGDMIRRKIIDAGDSFRQDYVCPETVVDIDDDGALVRSNGGFVRDDTDQLLSIAIVAYEWYSRQRHVLSLATELITAQITLGDYIEEVGDDSGLATPGLSYGHNQLIESVVTEIRIATRRQESSGRMGSTQPEPPRMMLTTGWGELDPLQMITPEDAPVDASRPKDVIVSQFDTTRGV